MKKSAKKRGFLWKDFSNFKIDNMDQIYKIGALMNSRDWYFRGLSKSKYNLTSTFERAYHFFYNLQQKYSTPGSEIDYRNFEMQYLNEFKQRAHQYLSNSYVYKNNLDWYSLLRHYGGPSRMVDFTTSFYIALFFAIPTENNNSCIWAINGYLLKNYIFQKLKRNKIKDYSLYVENNLNGPKGNNLVIPVLPNTISERMSIQQAQLLYPCELAKTFRENLYSTLKIKHEIDNKRMKKLPDEDPKILGNKLIKLTISNKLKSEIMRFLKSVNITHATMFPGLEGFCKSLYLPTDIEMEEAKRFFKILESIDLDKIQNSTPNKDS